MKFARRSLTNHYGERKFDRDSLTNHCEERYEEIWFLPYRIIFTLFLKIRFFFNNFHNFI